MSSPLSKIEAPLLEFVSVDLLHGEEEIETDTPLLALGVIDSLSMVSILSFIQRRFHVDIPNDSITVDNFEDVTAIAKIVHERMEIEGGGGGGQADETANERAVAALVKAGIRSTRYPLDGDVEMHTLAVDGDPNVPWVLVPGLGNPASAWGGLLKAIKFQHTALAVDPVGFGLSTGPEAPTYVDHAEHLRQLLQVRFSGQRVLLVASSMGGLAALELARRSPQTVAGLVLIGFGLVDDPAAWRAELDRLWARPEEFMSLAFKVPPRPSELYREQFEAARGRPAFRSYYAANDLGPTAIAGLEVPVLMIGGFDDQIVEIEVMRATAQLVPGELVEVARAGHFPERERPEEVVRGIEGFLRGKGLFG